MLRFYPLLLALWLLAFAAVAQPEPYYFSLPKAEPVLGAAASAWHVARVLDARTDRSRLGTVRRGLDNLAAPAMLTQPLPSALLAYCQQQLPARAGTRPVVLRVLDVSVGEGMGVTSETAAAELIGDFLELQADSSFRVLLPVGEFENRSGLEVTLFHPSNLARVLNQALAKLAALPAGTGTAPSLSRTEAYAGRGGAPRLPALARPPSAAGFYQSFADLQADKVTPAARAFELQPTPRSLKAKLGRAEEFDGYYLYLGPEQPREFMLARGAWGLSDGTKRYISHDGRFYPLQPGTDGRSFTFLALAPPDPAGATSRALVGGLVGGVVGAAAAAAAGPAGGLATYTVHLATGRVVFRRESAAEASAFAEPNPEAGAVYLFRRPDKLDTEPLLVQLNGRTVATLLPKQYVRLPAPGRGQELVLCLQRPTATAVTPAATSLLRSPSCLPIATDEDGAIYINCEIAPEGLLPPALHVVSGRTGKAQVQRMKSATPEQP